MILQCPCTLVDDVCIAVKGLLTITYVHVCKFLDTMRKYGSIDSRYFKQATSQAIKPINVICFG